MCDRVREMKNINRSAPVIRYTLHTTTRYTISDSEMRCEFLPMFCSLVRASFCVMLCAARRTTSSYLYDVRLLVSTRARVCVDPNRIFSFPLAKFTAAAAAVFCVYVEVEVAAVSSPSHGTLSHSFAASVRFPKNKRHMQKLHQKNDDVASMGRMRANQMQREGEKRKSEREGVSHRLCFALFSLLYFPFRFIRGSRCVGSKYCRGS